MKRQGENIINQPAVKKADLNVSTDFRSKIGAKLQTLLNGFTPERRLFPRNRRQLYEDLFGERHHSEIIIDPTIVIKTETPDIEECSNDASSLNSQNFLLSAKSRITELLNKQQGDTNKHPFRDSEKENTVSGNECAQTSSYKPNTTFTQTKSHSHLSNNSSKRRKISSVKDDFSEPTSSQVRLKNLVVVVEDFRKDGAKSNPSLTNELIENENSSLNTESNSGNTPSISEQSVNETTESNVGHEVFDTFVISDKVEVECIIDDDSSILNHSNSNLSTDICNSNENFHLSALNSKSSEGSKSSESVSLKDSNAIPNDIPLGDILLSKSTNEFSSIADDSELVDDPGIQQPVVDITSDSVPGESNIYSSNDPEVVLLCVKRPTHEVITLEDDNDDSEDVIEEVHKCFQCGKAFLAKSLLNFHIRMHGSDSSPPSS